MIAGPQYQELLADSRVVAFRRGCETLSTIVAALPWAALFVLNAAATYVRVGFGRWPVIYMDNVTLPFIDAVATATVLAAVSLVPVLVLFCVLLPVRFFVGLPVLVSRSSLVFLAGWVITIAALKWTAIGGFLDWVMD
jgi:hypothetical protein